MRHKKRLASGVALFLALAMIAGPAMAEDPAGLARFPDPVDPQSWVLPEDMTWDDYTPIPGVNWNDPQYQPAKKLRAALIVADYQDEGFVVAQPEGSDLIGNPQGVGSVPREDVADFYSRFLITEPQPLNRFHTVNEYWLENTYGLIGVDAEGFGPYKMDFKGYQYGLGGGDAGGAANACPQGQSCGKDFDTELLQKSLADVTAGQIANGEDYDFRFLLHAQYDESGTWQEFGEMKFLDRDAVSDEFGPTEGNGNNYAATRYVPWTSWFSAKGIWSHATPGVMSTQGENDGASTYAHEFSHILGVLDNYNNPYGNPVSRSYSGPWDMMSRGTFNGPGGPHNRWQVPGTLGGTMGSQHMLRNKIRMGFVRPDEVLTIEREALKYTGPVFADIWAREVPLGPTWPRQGLHGINITMANGDKTPSCSLATDWRCDRGGYQNYTVEVVDRMGYDSFTPDHGVLIAKTKNADTAPFIWVADAHPEDIDKTDFVRPDDSEAKVSKGDFRQLADALFHAGTGEGVVSEYVDEPNRLHFYVLANERDEDGVLSYRVAIRSLDGAGLLPANLSLAQGTSEPAAPGRVAVYNYEVSNPGLGTDLIRLSATTTDGWATTLQHNVIEVPAGSTVTVPVYVLVPEGATAPTDLTLTATSETDVSRTQASTRTVEPVN